MTINNLSKFYSQNCQKLVWKKYYSKTIDLSTARSIACKINSNQISKTSVSSYFLVKNGTNKIFEIKYFDVIK